MSLVCANSESDYAVIGVDLADENNLKKIKMVNCNGFAGIKYFKNG